MLVIDTERLRMHLRKTPMRLADVDSGPCEKALSISHLS